MKRLLIIVMGLFLLGCSNPYQKFYSNLIGGTDVTKEPLAIPLAEGEEPRIMNGNNEDKDCLAMMEEGYIPIGVSSFNTDKPDQKGLIDQAKKVHANLVLVYSKYSHTVSGAAPLLLPDSKTSTTSFSANAYSSGGGSSNLFGNAFTTTYGNQVISVPYNVDRYDSTAVYFVKRKPGVFGIQAKELSSDLRRKIGSNKGVLVFVVLKGSPAFQADILAGDIVKKIGTIEMTDLKSINNAAKKYAGKKVAIVLIRDGKEIIKEIKCNQLDS